jgi:hypothetical protein
MAAQHAWLSYKESYCHSLLSGKAIGGPLPYDIRRTNRIRAWYIKQSWRGRSKVTSRLHVLIACSSWVAEHPSVGRLWIYWIQVGIVDKRRRQDDAERYGRKEYWLTLISGRLMAAINDIWTLCCDRLSSYPQKEWL